jgi:3-deoxy-D-manno-octulosonate 8-phosphate phosphatase (KDO 8-P phosphatase)
VKGLEKSHIIGRRTEMLTKIVEGIKLLVLDVDGVLTDGRICINDRGEETKAYHVRDGYGIRLLMGAGIDVAIITGRLSKSAGNRAADLGIKNVFQGVADKKAVCMKLLEEKGLSMEQVCFIGDDLQDLPLLKVAGMPVAVLDAVKEVHEAALYVTGKNGGCGAVREVCELILKARNAWPVQ